MNRVVTSLPLPGLLRRAGWGVLLVPVVLLVASIFPWAIPWGVAAALAAAAVLLVPAVAADVATVGVIGLGIYASLLTSWMVLAFFSQTGNPFWRGWGNQQTLHVHLRQA